MNIPQSIEAVQDRLGEYSYLADRPLATAIYLCLRMEKPLFLEGEAGVGKTEVGKVLAELLATRLIRLQCYEGLDVHNAVYEWNYARQMIEIRLWEASGEKDKEKIARDIFGKDFLIRRPLLQAVDHDADIPPVLLIDELDRADEEFEAFLLEILSDYQVTVPEIGTLRSKLKPVVIITSNRTREIHDALKRRCLYHWIDYPDAARELDIVNRKVPEVTVALGQQVVTFVQGLRELDLYKSPGVAETLDWAAALIALGTAELTAASVKDTLGTLLKYQDDLQTVRGEQVGRLVERAQAASSAAAPN